MEHKTPHELERRRRDEAYARAWFKAREPLERQRLENERREWISALVRCKYRTF